MSTAEAPTFRTFAMAAMEGDGGSAVPLLAELLGVDEVTARSSTDHFRAQMATGQAFMMKAMGMRTVVEAKDEAALATLIEECFALAPEAAKTAASVVLARYA
jgi:hypothetical protein